MKAKKRTKTAIIVMVLCLIFVTSFGLAACSEKDNRDQEIVAVYNTYVAQAEADGKKPLSYEEWLKSIKGDKGDKGETGADGADGVTPHIGENGNWFIGDTDTGIKAQGEKGDKGETGADGTDGVTPHIGENGNWFIGDTDTGIKVQGEKGDKGETGADGTDGVTPHIGENGNWFIGDTDTGIKAQGEKGDKGETGADGTDGVTPHIGENGNWFIGDTDTGIKAQGEKGDKGETGADGTDGVTPHIGENGNWFIGDTDTGVKAQGEKGEQGDAHKHDFSYDEVTFLEPTCENNGLLIKYCECGVSRVEVLATKHALTQGTATLSDKTTKQQAYMCNDCGRIFSGENCEEALHDIYKFDTGVVIYTLSDEGYKASKGSKVYSAQEQVVIMSEVDGKPVTEIADSGFYTLSYNLNRPLELVVPASVIRLGARAFEGSKFSAITFAEGSALTTIGERAFKNCEKLSVLDLPSRVTEIGTEAFRGCKLLENINIDNGASFVSKDGVVYSADGRTLVAVGGGRTGELTVKDGVATIGSYALAYCTKLDKIILPDSVTAIRAYGMVNATYATAVLEYDGTLTTVEEHAFDGFHGVKNIKISAETIEDYAFYSCKGMTSVTLCEGVKTIGKNVFGQSGLISIELPASLVTIGDDAFSCCYSLTEMTVAEGSKLASIGNHVFQSSKLLVRVEIPASVTEIGTNAFYGTGLTEAVYAGTREEWNGVSVSKGNDKLIAALGFAVVKHQAKAATCTEKGNIEYYTYGDKYYIDRALTEEIALSDTVVEEKGHTLARLDVNEKCIDCDFTYGPTVYTLTGDHYVVKAGTGMAVGDIVIANKINGIPVTEVASKAFYKCTKLTSIVIPNSVTSIGEYAFQYCSKLTSVSIPDSVTSIESSAFYNCNNLKYNEYDNAYYLGNNGNSYSALIKTKNKDITACVIHDKTKLISDLAFYNCSKLTSIAIPDSVASIGSSAFRGSGLTSITVNEGNTVYHSVGNCIIETEAKKLVLGCKNSVIPTDGSVTSIGKQAFYECSKLTSIAIPDSVTSIGEEAFYNCSGLTSIAIPDGVASIGEWAFGGCRGITSIELHDSVTGIGSSAFRDCIGLTSIVISDSVTSIGSSAFSNCSKLTSIVIPDGVTSIESFTFYKCSKLTSIVIPDSVTSIGEYAFRDCIGLTSIVIPDSVTSIGSYMFYNCSGLTSIVIPDGVTSIGSYMFYGCSKLTSIVIPDSVTSIGGSAFSGCKKLSSIAIPDGITIIETNMFYGCSKLTSIVIPDSVTSIKGGAFQNCSGLKEVYYSGTAEEWSKVTVNSSNNNYLTSATVYFYSETEPVEKNGFWHYNENGELALWSSDAAL